MYNPKNLRSLHDVAQEKSLQDFRRTRNESILAATVTTKSGKVFDADEKAINRMTQRLLALTDKAGTFKLMWSLATDETGVMSHITKAELAEAQKLASDQFEQFMLRQ